MTLRGHVSTCISIPTDISPDLPHHVLFLALSFSEQWPLGEKTANRHSQQQYSWTLVDRHPAPNISKNEHLSDCPRGGSPFCVRRRPCSPEEDSFDPRLCGHCNHLETCKNSNQFLSLVRNVGHGILGPADSEIFPVC